MSAPIVHQTAHKVKVPRLGFLKAAAVSTLSTILVKQPTFPGDLVRAHVSLSGLLWGRPCVNGTPARCDLHLRQQMEQLDHYWLDVYLHNPVRSLMRVCWWSFVLHFYGSFLAWSGDSDLPSPPLSGRLALPSEASSESQQLPRTSPFVALRLLVFLVHMQHITR